MQFHESVPSHRLYRVFIRHDEGAHCQDCGDLIIPTAQCRHDWYFCSRCGVLHKLCTYCRQQRTCRACGRGLLLSVAEMRFPWWWLARGFWRVRADIQHWQRETPRETLYPRILVAEW